MAKERTKNIELSKAEIPEWIHELGVKKWKKKSKSKKGNLNRKYENARLEYLIKKHL